MYSEKNNSEKSPMVHLTEEVLEKNRVKASKSFVSFLAGRREFRKLIKSIQPLKILI